MARAKKRNLVSYKDPEELRCKNGCPPNALQTCVLDNNLLGCIYCKAHYDLTGRSVKSPHRVL